MSWKQSFMHHCASMISNQKMWIQTWKQRRSKDHQRLLDLLRNKLEKRSHRLAYLDSFLPEYDPWNDDLSNLILLSDIHYLHGALENLYPDSIGPMLTILEKESMKSKIVWEIFHLLSDIQEERALPAILKFLREATDPDEIAELLWFVGHFGRVAEIIDRNRPLGLIRYLEYDRVAYHAYLDDEVREKKLQKWRLELLPEIEPYLTHSNERVRTTAYIAMKMIIPFEDHPMFDEFEKENPDLDYEAIRLEYNPPSCLRSEQEAEGNPPCEMSHLSPFLILLLV